MNPLTILGIIILLRCMQLYPTPVFDMLGYIYLGIGMLFIFIGYHLEERR